MRAEGCAVQQALTAEAASVVKQAVALARRRRHAQVTPLHVANTMLTASTGLLRTACLQSHSHPLQCKALELCFNVELNRLPGGPMLGTHSHHQHFPSISNALVAAFKRAQAHHQRRGGSIENQQQKPLLAVKIGLEQLIISVLDDPSVSRVMREAGFNSAQVKSNVDQACKKDDRSNVLDHGKPTVFDPIRDEDVRIVIENLVNRRRKGSSTVIVGECVSTIEGVVKGVMDKFDEGDVPEGLRDVKLITLSLSSLGHLNVIEQKLKEIKSSSSDSSRGFVLYLGDLKWIIEQRSREQVEHMIREIGRLLVCESGRFSILGIGSFQTYMRCKTSYPSVESVWGLHPLTIPANSLCLSLITTTTDSDLGSQSKNNKAENGHDWMLLEGEELTCCAECSAKFKDEAKSLHSGNTDSISCSTSSTLPAWLQQYKNENQRPNSMDKDCLSIKDLCKKWNSICSSKPCSSEKAFTLSSLSPSPSTYGFSYDQHGPNVHQTHYPFSVVEPKMPWRRDYNPTDPSLRIYIPPSTSNPNSTQNSASSSEVMEIDQYVRNFNEYNSENLTTLCNALERKLPSNKDTVQDIASTILQCRSGMGKRKDKRETTWLLFQGNDVEAKEKIAKEFARVIFSGSSRTDNFVSISLSSFSSTRAYSTHHRHHHHQQDCTNNYKRSRDEQSSSYIERFVEAVSSNPHRVFLLEDMEQADYCSLIGFKRAIERGRVSNVSGIEVGLSDAIIILSCESLISRSRACFSTIKEGSTLEETSSHCVSTLDLNVSIEDDSVEDQSVDDIGLLDSVDRRFVFKMPS
ncbi:chaperone protein ClpB4 mitochondrial [Tripterygium wilfordii]|uniref:Chaperone protein ClpB4 mitochondrial n=1 Tax=Tripterygium wilfordii TaxID=458696 RepID=A0A7J7DN23_TRIWF|nr:protein SMAX1-LIKE 3-like [Tripterygium wilfordii]KAF5747765.1 chaperone protein ClpB4 mitochondrial [Tripterygium wilfordii]